MSSMTGEIREREDGGFAGWIATPAFDFEITLVKHRRLKGSQKPPDYDVFTTSPAGRNVLMGAAWEREDRFRNGYLALVIDIDGRDQRVSALARYDTNDPKAEKIYELLPLRS